MRIGIDGRFLTHPQRGGFKTYTSHLVLALAEIDQENDYLIYTDRQPTTSVPLGPNFTVRIVPESLPWLGMPWREQVALAAQAKADRLDLFHAPCLTAPLWLSCPLVVTIHDMIWHFPQQFSNGKSPAGRRKLMGWYYQTMPKWAAQRAALVLTVSQAAKGSIVDQLGLPEGRIVVTHGAASPLYGPVQDPARLCAVRQRVGLPSDFILALGSADPRKNLSALVRAYAQLPTALQAQHPLGIVWTHRLLEADLLQEIEALGIRSHVRFLTGVDDETLALLFNAASLFVFPSRYEGFGLPLLEAMSSGAPVVAADNSSIPEVVGDAALLVSADDVRTIAHGMTRVLTEPALRNTLIEKGYQRAAAFSWRNCGQETLAAYRRAVTV
jgi:glycosyltransferase involved in cell wall biosynthesis